MARDKNNKEIPTITSLLNRKKLKVRTPEEAEELLDRSQPLDLRALEKEFEKSEFSKRAEEADPDHPPIQGIDCWDTRGIARAVKHNSAARKTTEFKDLLGKENTRSNSRSYRVKKEGTGSMTGSSKVTKRPPPPPPPLNDPDAETHKQPTAKPARPVMHRAPAEPTASMPKQPSAPRAPTAPAAPTAPRAPAAPARAPAPPSIPMTPPIPGTPGTAPHAPSTVQPAAQRGRRDAPRPPTTWTMQMLKGGPDPLGKGLSILLDKGAGSALFLAITPPPPGAKIPHFAAAAAAQGTPEQIRIWTGLRWDPAVVPQVWNALLKSGFVEFHPPGNVTNADSRRNTIRAAFGLGGEQILTLVRVGPVAACRGILAIYSGRSLLLELGPILTLFNTPLPLLQKAA
jgi:hypothetical protein